MAEAEGAPSYLLLDDALDRKLAEVTEVSTGGSVPELAFENRSAEKILLVDDGELVAIVFLDAVKEGCFTPAANGRKAA